MTARSTEYFVARSGLSSASISIPIENTTITERYCSTDLKLHKYRHEWTINNFKLFTTENGECLVSPSFDIGVDDTKCVINLYPNGKNPVNVNSVSLSVELKTKQRFNETNIMCCMLNAKKQEIGICNSKDLVLKEDFFSQRSSIFDEKHGLLPEGKLTILCEISLFSESFTIERESSKGYDYTRNTLEDVFLNGQFCDVTFAVGDRELRAHKVVLAANSDVFAAMFEHKMEENTSDRVTISDIDCKVFKEMLYFIYSDKAPNLNEMAHDLFAAADKYNIKTLKKMCHKAMSAKLAVETAVETLILADLHGSDELKVQSIDIIKKNFKDVVKTEAWKEIIATYPHLVSEMILMCVFQNVK